MATRKLRLNRRTMLRGMLGGTAVGIGLPMLDIFLNDHGTAMAEGDAFPTRFGLFFWGNGMLPPFWNPTATGDTWELSQQLSPLANVKSNISVVTGMKVYTGNPIAHESGAAGMLSGSPLIVKPDSNTFAVPSIDQVIANEIGKDTRFKSIETGVTSSGGNTWSFSGPNSRNPTETSPFALYNRIFGEGFFAPGETPIIDPKIALRRSVLDAVMGDSTRLQNTVGARDKIRLQQHFDGVRDLEKRLAKLEEDPPNLASCKHPDAPLMEFPEVEGRLPISEISRAHCDLLAMAFACDQTRVFSHFITHSVSNSLFPGIPEPHHQLTHDEPGDQPEVSNIVQQIITEFAYLVEALKKIPEGDKTLLDHCAVLATSDCSYGRQHLLEEFPIVIAGSANGKLKENYHYRSPSFENTSKVLLTLTRAVGLNLDSFGTDAGKVTESLTAIEV
jgi:hypothetical protein